MPIYKVRDPTGAVREISGPEGASDEEVIAQAQKLFASKPAEQPAPEQPQAEPSMMQKVGAAGLQGMIRGGPIPAVLGMAGAGLENMNDLISKGAYKAGGAVSEGATKLGASPEVAGGAGYATNVALQAIPALIGGQAGSKAGNLLQTAGQKVMKSALKPSTTMAPGKAAAAVKTMLDEGANVTAGGIEKLQGKRAALASAVDDILNNSSAKVNKYQVAKALRDTEGKFANQVTPTSDLDAIQRVKGEFLRTRPTTMPIKEAHELKKGTYAVLGDKAYKGELKAAETEAQKALARGLRQQTESGAPEIAPLNAKQSELINAIKAAISREAVSGNKDPIGLGFMAANPKVTAAFMANRSELAKSLLARLLYSGGKPMATAAGAGVGAAYANQEE